MPIQADISGRVTRSASKRRSYAPTPELIALTKNSDRPRRTTRKVPLIIESDSDSDTESIKAVYPNRNDDLLNDKEIDTKVSTKINNLNDKSLHENQDQIIIIDSDSDSDSDAPITNIHSQINKQLNNGYNCDTYSTPRKIRNPTINAPMHDKVIKTSIETCNKNDPLLLTPKKLDNIIETSIKKSNKNPITPKKVLNTDSDLLSKVNELLSPKKLNTTPRKKKSLTADSDYAVYSPVTPPKQKKSNENNENILFSPSTLLQKLDLNSSPTKKINEATFEPKKLFEGSVIYQNARKALHSTVPVQMPGREKEHSELRTFIKHHLDNKTSGTLYVSGPPGTGKTASLSTILQQPDIISEFKEVYVNCTAIKSSGSIYCRILKELGIKCSGKSEKDYIAAIELYLSRNHKMILLVLDEIDQLESKKQSVLYTIFEWPSRPHSKIVLIGIANALDLTDRILPRLQARCELKPTLMHFAPYSKAQIIEIFTNRLKTAGVLDLFAPMALQMLAGKVASISGDVRRALDIGRRVVEIVEKHKKDDALKAIDNLETQPIEAMKHKAVDLKHVMSVLNSVYGTSNNLCEESDDTFPLQQKIVVCTLLLILKKARNKDVTIGKLHEVYRKVCVKRNLLGIDQGEFVGLCQLIETKGIIRVSGKKEPRLHKVNLEWDEEEVSNALKDKQLMSTILQDDSCLGKL